MLIYLSPLFTYSDLLYFTELARARHPFPRRTPSRILPRSRPTSPLSTRWLGTPRPLQLRRRGSTTGFLSPPRPASLRLGPALHRVHRWQPTSRTLPQRRASYRISSRRWTRIRNNSRPSSTVSRSPTRSKKIFFDHGVKSVYQFYKVGSSKERCYNALAASPPYA